MSDISKSFDPIWEDIYADGRQLNKYPFNFVPNFFFKWLPRDKPISEVNVLEVGFGAGNNLWMCAREGAQVFGIDAAPSGVAFANERFSSEGLPGDLRVGDFTELPFDDDFFDIVLNRQALTQVSHTNSKKAVSEIFRCMKKQGVFWSNMFSDKTFRNGRCVGDGLWTDIDQGELVNVGQTAFHTRQDILDMYADSWEMLEIKHMSLVDQTMEDDALPYCEWYVTSRKL